MSYPTPSSSHINHDLTSPLEDRKLAPCPSKPLYIALIILGIVGAGTAVVGVLSYGGHQGWWTASMLTKIEVIPAVIMAFAGTGGAFVLITIGIVGRVKHHIDEIVEANETALTEEQRKNIDLQRQLEEKQNEIVQTRAAQNLLQEEKERIQHSLAAQESAIQRLTREQTQHTCLLQAAEQVQTDLRDQLNSTSDVLSRTQEARDTLTANLLEATSAQEKLKVELQKAISLQEHLKTQLQETSAKQEAHEQRVQEIDRQLQEITAERDRLNEKLSTPSTPSPNLIASVTGEWTVVASPPPIPSSPIEQSWETFDYDQIAEQKYQVVMDEYVRRLTPAMILSLKAKVEAMRKLDQSNQMLEHLEQVLMILMSYQAKPRQAYQGVVRTLRLVILSKEYVALPAKNEELSIDLKEIRRFVRFFCLQRWSGTYLYNYLKQIILLTTGKDQLPAFTKENYSETILELNREIKKSRRNKKSTLALEGQKLFGALGWEDFCGSKNTPNVQNIQVFKDNSNKTHTVTYVRHGSPTALGPSYYKPMIVVRKIVNFFANQLGYEIDSGEEVTADYKEYLRALAEKNESELFCVFQRRTLDWGFENERPRALKIDDLQSRHPNCHVLTQSVEGDLFEHKGAYAKMTTFAQLKESLEREFFETDPNAITTRSTLPLCIRGDANAKAAYRTVFRKLLDDVGNIFFPNEEQAIDPQALNASLSHIQQQLDAEHGKQIEAIQKYLGNINLEAMEPVDHSSLHESIFAQLLQDAALKKTLEQKIREQIRTFEQLEKWVAVDRTKSIDEELNNNAVMEQLIQLILVNAAEIAPKEELKAIQLEKEKAHLLSKWQSFILLFYTIQRMDLKFRLNGVKGYQLTMYKTPCKDFLDRGGNEGLVEDRLSHYILGEEDSPSRMRETASNLLGPPILVKKKEVIERRILPGLEVEKLLASMSAESLELLRAYRFGEAEWRFVGVLVPKERGQSAVPLISRQLKQEIAATPEDADLVSHFKQYEGIDLKQPEEVVLDSTKTYEEALFFPEGITINKVSCDYATTKAQLMQHRLINGDEAKAIAFLSACYQATLSPHPVLSVIGNKSEKFNLQRKPQYLLDLSKHKKIICRISEEPLLTAKNSDTVATFSSTTKVTAIRKQDKSLQTTAYIQWFVKKSSTGLAPPQ